MNRSILKPVFFTLIAVAIPSAAAGREQPERGKSHEFTLTGKGIGCVAFSADGEWSATRWKRLLETHRAEIRAGKQFEMARDPITAELFPFGFRFQRKDSSHWPPNNYQTFSR